MKKKLLLIALPALMAFTGCSRVNAQPALKKDVSLNGIVEDTLAHEELFGATKQIKGPTVKRMGELDDESNYKIGYQLHYDDVKDEISIRFVAAIKADYASMVWSRGLARGNGDLGIGFGDEKYGSSDKLESKVVYTSLSNGNEDIATAGVDAFSDFTGFVVYSMTGIPYSTYSDSYIGASLKLHPAEGDDIVTPVYAIKVERNPSNLDRSLFTFSFENRDQGYFLSGTFKNAGTIVYADYPKKNNDKATFTADFEKNDEFLIVKKTNSEFRVWDSSSITDPGHVKSHFGETETGDRIKANDSGHMRLFLNNDNYGELYASDSFTPDGTGIYIRGSMNGWLDGGAQAAYELLSDNEDSQGILTNITFAVDDEFKIARLSWDAGNWGYGSPSGCRLNGNAAGNFTGSNAYDNNSNIRCLVAGTYNIMLGQDHIIYIWNA